MNRKKMDLINNVDFLKCIDIPYYFSLSESKKRISRVATIVTAVLKRKMSSRGSSWEMSLEFDENKNIDSISIVSGDKRVLLEQGPTNPHKKQDWTFNDTRTKIWSMCSKAIDTLSAGEFKAERVENAS